jgi:hypothetical protein
MVRLGAAMTDQAQYRLMRSSSVAVIRRKAAVSALARALRGADGGVSPGKFQDETSSDAKIRKTEWERAMTTILVATGTGTVWPAIPEVSAECRSSSV